MPLETDCKCNGVHPRDPDPNLDIYNQKLKPHSCSTVFV